MKVREKLRRLRSRDGRSGSEVARAIGVSEAKIRAIESGEIASVKLAEACRIGQFFNVSLDWLADDSQDWPPPASGDEQILDTVRKALAPYAGPEGLTEQERRLLAEFRQMKPAFQNQALKTIADLRELESQPSGGPVDVERVTDEIQRIARERKVQRANPADQKNRATG